MATTAEKVRDEPGSGATGGQERLRYVMVKPSAAGGESTPRALREPRLMHLDDMPAPHPRRGPGPCVLAATSGPSLPERWRA